MILEELETLEFARPRPRGGRRRVGRTLVVRLHVSAGPDRFIGVGEVPASRWTPEVRQAGWSALDRVAEELRRRETDLVEAIADDVLLRTFLGELAAPSDPNLVALGSAVQTAITDACGRALGVPMSQILRDGGAQPTEPPLTAPAEVDGRGADAVTLVRRITAQRSAGPVRLRIDAHPAVLAPVEQAMSTLAPGRRRLLLRLSGEPRESDLVDLLRELARGLRRGRAIEDALVELPRGWSSFEQIARLQAEVESRRSLRARFARGTPPRILLPGDDPEVRRGTADLRRVRAMSLDPVTLGGPLTTMELARRAIAVQPTLQVVLVTSRGGSEITAALGRSVAAALPRCDLLVDAPVTKWGHRPRAGSGGPQGADVSVGSEGAHGLGTDINVVAAAALLRDYQRYPLRRSDGRGSSEGPPVRYPRHVERVKKWALDNHHLEREALVSGLRTVRVSTQSFVADDPASGRAIVFDMSVGHASSSVGRRLTVNKARTAELLAGAGVPVPEGRAFGPDEVGAAASYARELGFPLVVKPTGGSLGIGVTSNIRDVEQLDWALAHLAEQRYARTGILVERHLTGEDYRAYVLDGRVVSVILRRPAVVVGDGHHTVEDLVFRYNAQRIANPYLGQRQVTFDDTTLAHLDQQRLRADDVPAPGQRVPLRSAANVSQGGRSFEVLDETHPAVLTVLARTTAAIPGLPTGGVDVIMEDHRRPPSEQEMAVIEINSKAELSLHHYPTSGRSRNVAREVLRWYRDRIGLPEPPGWPSTLAVSCQVDGAVVGVGYEDWLAREASRLGVDHRVQPRGPRLAVELEGESGAVAPLIARLLEGPRGARPVMVVNEPDARRSQEGAV